MARYPFGVRQWPEPMLARPNETLSGNVRALRDMGEKALAEPFCGITTDGVVRSGLFRLRETGASTAPIAAAAQAFLNSLRASQRSAAVFPVDSRNWRSWVNIHPYVMRHGVCFEDLTLEQRRLAFALLAATTSSVGFETARNVMKLNETVAEMTGKHDEFGEWYYWLSIFGSPSTDEPWGWQIDGHHLNLNCLVLGEQMVMTPTFLGSEPCLAEGGAYVGTRVFAAQESDGLAVMDALDAAQRVKATIGAGVGFDATTAFAFRDNLVLPYAGINYQELSAGQQQLVRALIAGYVGVIRPAHAGIRTTEVVQHFDETWFAWAGPDDASALADPESVFYYRVHSPVILIEFDHQSGVAFDNPHRSRNHIHTVVRTPNGNDYGADLLAQHHARFKH